MLHSRIVVKSNFNKKATFLKLKRNFKIIQKYFKNTKVQHLLFCQE